jgi:hypothetical protein
MSTHTSAGFGNTLTAITQCEMILSNFLEMLRLFFFVISETCFLTFGLELSSHFGCSFFVELVAL